MTDSPKRRDGAVSCTELRDVALFSNLDDVELERLAKGFVELRVPADHFIHHEDELSDAFYVIREGAVAAFRDAVGEPAQLLARLHQGDFFGEIGLFGTSTHSASVRATEPSRLLRIPKEDFLPFLDDHPEVKAELETVAIRRHGANLAAALKLGQQREVRMRLDRDVVLRLEDGTAHPVRLENLSVGGFCLHGAPQSWQPVQSVGFALELGIGTLRFAGRIAWRRGDAVGMAFTEMSSNHDAIIQLAIHLLLESASHQVP
ncbi:MAG: cyclic nucleotide-binding domain-containing protein [bacterium]|nr:cyclic nucleotide-binding domain-containing protein [bacterium]